ncbi:MAG: hypothetical protein ACI8WB_000302 [Phenylobacterium sp.]|jgi:uncharacterized protein (DUF952 family)
MNNQAIDHHQAQYIYLLAGQQEYDQALAAGELVRDSLQNEGFIHASPADQLSRVANKHYTNVANVLVLVVEQQRITPPVKWQPATGGLYPHIFGPMNMDAVIEVQAIKKDEHGVFSITIE